MFKGGGGMGMSKMLKQAKKMQDAMLKMQQDLALQTVTGTAGGGAVEVVATGDQQVKAVKIKPEAVDPEDVETLEDLVLAAVRDALDKASKLQASQMGEITGGMPGMGF